MKDLLEQIAFVDGSIERILWQIDRDPLSPTHGCAHLAFWRDKTSDVADARRQEAMLPLALLYIRDYPGSRWHGDPRLKSAVVALLKFWVKSQYCDGSFDEWYAGERAYAAAAFTTFAVSMTLLEMHDNLPHDISEAGRKAIGRSADWLCRRNDLFKTNHQAVGAAALAWAGKLLDTTRYRQQAKKKLDSIVAVQTTEGWFPEVGAMDPGYTFLTVEYATAAMDALGDWSQLAPFIRAFDFACELLKPNLSVCSEAGICKNPYFSRIAAIRLAEHSSFASRTWDRLSEETPDFSSYANVLGDDLRLLRWAFQPLVAYDTWQACRTRKRIPSKPLPLEGIQKEVKIFPEAGFVRFNKVSASGIVIAANGGPVWLFGGNAHSSSFADIGYAFQSGDGFATNMCYDKTIGCRYDGDILSLLLPIVRVKKFFPPFWARVLLRFACSTTIGSRVARGFIDFIRGLKGTPVNQSSGNISGSECLGEIRRDVLLGGETITLRDDISLRHSLSLSSCLALSCTDEDGMQTKPLQESATSVADVARISVEKIYAHDGKVWNLSSSAVKV
ncbi:MAG: hypothetical protein HQM09_17775 [Candidatus Riflebacteria bacterium]|nr:hypothetical protein [Candidatus Riflebacteria bacterium]